MRDKISNSQIIHKTFQNLLEVISGEQLVGSKWAKILKLFILNVEFGNLTGMWEVASLCNFGAAMQRQQHEASSGLDWGVCSKDPCKFSRIQVGRKWDQEGRKWDGSGTEEGRKWDGSGSRTEAGRNRDGTGTEVGRKWDGSGTEEGRKWDGSGTE